MWKYLRVIFLILPHLLWNWPIFLFYKHHPEKTPLEVRYRRVRRLVLRLIRAFHVDFSIDHLSSLHQLEKKNQSFLLVCNHISFLDPLFMIFLSEKPISFVAKKEVEKYPLIPTILGAIEGLYLDRDDLRGSIAVIRKLENNLEKNDCNWGIFPEGTRRKDLSSPLLPYHPGSFKAALLSEKPILVAVIKGSEKVLDFSSYARYPVDISFVEVLSTKKEELHEKGTVELAEYCQKISQEAYSNLLKRQEEYFALGLQKIPYQNGKKVR